MDARVEAYVDGDLPDDEKERFEQLMDEDDYWEKQVNQACRIRDSLRTLPEPSAPPKLTKRIFDQTSRAHRALPWWKDVLQSVMHTWRALVAARQRPVVDYAVGLSLVAVAVFFIAMPIGDGTTPDGVTPRVSSQLDMPIAAPYSEAEVQRATVKAKWTLDHVSDVGRTASEAVQEQLREALQVPSGSTQTATSSSGSPAHSPTP
jgi:anti-sigma factor RsiW